MVLVVSVGSIWFMEHLGGIEWVEVIIFFGFINETEAIVIEFNGVSLDKDIMSHGQPLFWLNGESQVSLVFEQWHFLGEISKTRLKA